MSWVYLFSSQPQKIRGQRRKAPKVQGYNWKFIFQLRGSTWLRGISLLKSTALPKASQIRRVVCTWRKASLFYDKLLFCFDFACSLALYKGRRPPSNGVPGKALTTVVRRLWRRSNSLTFIRMSMTIFACDARGNPPLLAESDIISGDLPDADVQIVTSTGLRIPAHRRILVPRVLWSLYHIPVDVDWGILTHLKRQIWKAFLTRFQMLRKGLFLLYVFEKANFLDRFNFKGLPEHSLSKHFRDL